MKIAGVAILLLLSGCATCKQHPTVCGAGALILGTSIALSLQKNDDTITRRPPFCGPTGDACR